MNDRPTSIYKYDRADWQTWAGTPVAFGIKWFDIPTTPDDLAQLVAVLDEISSYPTLREEIPWYAANVAGVLGEYLREWKATPRLAPQADYSAYVLGWSAKEWLFTFDLALHDAAHHATKAGKPYAEELWCLSRQLRQDRADEEARRRVIDDAKSGHLLTPVEYLRAACSSVVLYLKR